jgi:hypothetical protein
VSTPSRTHVHARPVREKKARASRRPVVALAWARRVAERMRSYRALECAMLRVEGEFS